MEHADVLIVGGGIAGLATAYWLTRERGLTVVLVERTPRLGAGASGQSAAILRTFGPDALTNALARAGAAFLRRPPRELAGRPLLDACGLVLAASGACAAEMAALLAREGEPEGAERLGRNQLLELVPHLKTVPDFAAHFPGDGRIEVGALLEALATGARDAGCVFHTDSVVLELLCSGRAIEGARLADGREMGAGLTVLAAGAWAGEIGRRAGSPVRLAPTRRHLLVTQRDARLSRRWPALWLEDAGFYCRPEEGGMLLCACDQDPVAPDGCTVEPGMRARIAAKAARHLTEVPATETGRLWCGTRTLTSDGRFALGADPELRGLFWVAGLGGHGLSAGVEVGRLAAELVRGRAIAPDIARSLAPARLLS